ncbi:MAG: outer membrane beta-barrel domain-containing protein [Deltaproteobacteria bacterium]|nr:outer membrane beta-barrel domain-containing protein [Deltaproteobacteria bacterium]
MFEKWAWRTVIGVLALCTAIPTAFAQDRTRLDDELDKVWGEERDIQVIEKRMFEKAGRHEFGLVVGIIPNDPFFNYYPLGIRYDYHFLESVAFEISAAYTFHPESGLRSFIPDNFNGIDEVRLPQRVEWYASALVNWTPIHGKLAIMSTKLSSFDLGFVLGLAAVGTYVDNGKGGWKYKNAPDPAGVVGIGFRFFLHELVALRLGYRFYIYSADDGGARTLSEISLGVSVFTAPLK